MKQIMILVVVLALCLILCPAPVKGQGQKSRLAWQTGFDSTSVRYQSIVVTKENNYIVSSTDFYSHHGIAAFNKQGETLWRNEGNVCQMIDMNLTNNFLALNYFDNIVTMFNYNGDTIKNIAPPVNAEKLKWTGYISKDAGHYYVSYYDSLGDNCSIIVYDNDVQYVESFTIAINRQDAFDGLVAIDGYIYLSKSGYGQGQQSNVVSDIYKYSQSGQIIWRKHLLDRTKMCLAKSPDNQLYMGALNTSSPTNAWLSWEFSKLDTAGNFLWDKLWFDEYPDTISVASRTHDFKAIPGGGCVISGSATKLGLNTSYAFDLNNVEPVIVGFSDQGEKIYELRYTSLPSYQQGTFLAIEWDNEKYLVASGVVSYQPWYQALYKYSLDGVTGIRKESPETPSSFSLSQNYPNPFNPSTTINFSVVGNGLVSLKVYDLLGREVATLVNEELKSGNYSYKFNAEKLTSGIYVYRLTTKTFTSTKKMMLVK